MKRLHFSLLPLILAVAATSAVPARAQKLFTQAGEELNYADIKVQAGNVVKQVKEASTGQMRDVNIPISQILRLDFPEPTELQAAEVALIQHNGDEALVNAETVIKMFEPFKTTPGTWFPAASLVKLEALAIKQDTEKYDRLRSDLKAMNLSTADRVRLGLVEASQDFFRGVTGPAKAAVLKLLPDTDDASVLAKLYLLLGDIEYKREAFKEALDAYLHVPVFYGTQAEYLASAELGAARSLMKMQRLDDALQYFHGVRERYPKSRQATAAAEDLKLVEKALGESAQATTADPAEAPEKPEEK